MHLLVVAPTAVSGSGMDKSGIQPVNTNTSNVKVTGWVARAGYEESSIVSDELVVGEDLAAVIRCRISLTAAWSPLTGALQVSLVRNSAVLATESFASGSSSLTLADVPLNLSSGDRIWVQMANTTSIPYNRDATVQAGSTTYLTVEAA
ncbi:hypothetical protein [Nocardia sp. AG03]|uniref:hypothetical protein n=1 Tax=Nocardia sp. AG03 TaxID=3025312 RepID=UPI0024187184|nr:hypothetical protein [Nocardia sp. AG03]